MKSQNVATQDKIWAEVYGYNLTFKLTNEKSSSFEDIYPYMNLTSILLSSF